MPVDAAGNITQDNLGQQYTYDAEGRIASEGSTTYKYDADGQLVYENGPHGAQAFLRNSAGQTVSIYNPGGGSTPYSTMYAYIDGEKIGSWQPDVFHFTGQDGLGTKRYESDGYGDIASGTKPIYQTSFTSLPFGDMLSSIGTDPTHFTGKERDLESGNDYFGARFYSSSTGRFMSPDPSGLAFADPTNPQSFNLYSYALNNPLKFTDPTGMYCDYTDHNDPAGGFDQFQFDYHSSEKECTALDENGNRGAWVNDAYTHQDADGQWVDNEGRDPNAGAISSSVDAGGKAPLSGDFSFNMTSTQFIAMMEQSGIRVSVFDTLLGLHAGLNLRGEQSICSIHVTLAPFAGQYGNPASGSFHIDEYNPLTFEPPVDGSPMDVNGGGMHPMSNLGPHVTQDVIPD